MFANYTKNLYKKLLQQDFHPMVFGADTSISDDTMFLSLINYESEITYVVNLLNCINYKPDECMGKTFLSKASLLDKYNNSNIIFLNIFITDDNQKCKSYIDKLDKNMLKTFKDIFWSVQISSDNNISMYVDDVQPSKFLGIEKLIMNTPVNSGYSSAESIESITKEAMEESPIHYSNTSSSIFPFYSIIIFINILAYFVVLENGGFTTENLLNVGAFSYDRIIHQHEYYRLITCMFLHGGLMHLSSNMLTLFIFGSRLERSTSSFTFICIYFLAGLTANALMLLHPSDFIMVGASGCIFGVIGATLILSVCFKKSIYGLNFTSILIIALLNLATSLVDPEISFPVHFIGFIVGILLGYVYVLDARKVEKQNA